MTTRKNYPRYPLSDSGNAELFAQLYKDNVLFDHKQQRWLIWNATQCRWSEDKTKQVREFGKEAAKYRLKVLMPNLPSNTEEERQGQKREARWAIESQSFYRINAALELAKSAPSIADTGEGWDANLWLLGVANGIVDLRTGKLRAGTQQDRITKFSPVAFDAMAMCPRFGQFMLEIFNGDVELVKYVQKACGYSLTGSIREQCFFGCYGKGQNGKTTLLEILLYITGDCGVDLPFSALETKHYTIGEGVNLPGARFAKSVETREGRQLDEARIKSWTGGDTISIRPLHRNAFSFHPTHKLWLAFNHKPVIRDDSDAMWRRVRLIPFLRTFDREQVDNDLPQKLSGEASGILNWLIEGCLAWQKDGLKAPDAVERATREYEDASDPLAPFFEDYCDVGVSFSVPKGELRTAHEQWCAANKEKPLNRNAFAEKMRDRGFGDGNTGSTRLWTGIRLRPTDTTDTTKDAFPLIPIESDSMGTNGKEGRIASVASADAGIKGDNGASLTQFSRVPSLAEVAAPAPQP